MVRLKGFCRERQLKPIRLFLFLLGQFCLSISLFADMVDDFEDLEDVKTVKPPTKKVDESKKEQSTNLPMGGTKSKSPLTSSPKKPKKAQRKDDEERKNLPIKLKSDGQATYSKNGGIVELEENVSVSQGNLSFRSDRAKAYFIEVNGENIVDKVEIFGNVRVTKNTINPADKVKATGNRAYFFNSKRTVTLIGNARLWQGGHLIKGTQITYDLDTGIVKVDRAEGIVNPKDNK